MDTSILYLQDYAREEEAVMQSIGVSTYRSKLETKTLAPWANLIAPAGRMLVRGPRLSLDEFATLWRDLQGLGIDTVTSPDSFRLAGSFELHYPMLGALSPRAVVADASSAGQVLLEMIAAAGLAPPIFIRSDVESAAKYVGIEGCVMRAATPEELARVMANLAHHVKGFSRIIAKEMLPIAANRAGRRLEYRAVGARGKLIAFDYEAVTIGLPTPEDVGLIDCARRAFHALETGGLNGAVFMDFAILEGGRPIVVECKDFVHGTIVFPTIVGEAIKCWC